MRPPLGAGLQFYTSKGHAVSRGCKIATARTYITSMAILEILHYPDPRLRQTAAAIDEFDAALSSFIDDMFETMYDAPGVGLAATQVGRGAARRRDGRRRGGKRPHRHVQPGNHRTARTGTGGRGLPVGTGSSR